ncbi:YcjX family protein [Blastochloris tepida]|jgi:predicted YcjX-like family ATPase|uniref:Amino acid regulated cytosolic protein n=1 Tax=Blastochloris tepida TaxID=2233851 RepID=A0A348FWZ6_9HYPH|nr:YcjX family protein [Blastochloris tepida]BBF91829.1 hypothetical protein BLTE_05140 [Blastochloris tepida]
MSSHWTNYFEDARIAARAARDYVGGFSRPTLRLGVTGLSRAGKTVFITALVDALLHGGALPVFEAMASGRIARAVLEPQPDDAVPRFDVERHMSTLTGVDRRWPESTTRISELRIALTYQPKRGFGTNERTLVIDIVDYPGEWLLDLPLLTRSYLDWSREAVRLSREPVRAPIAADWHAHLQTLDPDAPAAETEAVKAATLFRRYLTACRQERFSLSLLPPGRFLMPGDLENSPALTFAPLDLPEFPGEAVPGSMRAMMERRYEAYRSAVVRPFFRDHFARLDRQIVLVDVLSALNAGPEAVCDLENAIATILEAFRTGRRNLLSSLVRPRIDRVLFAATKADHLHHASHDRLEAFLRRLADRAIRRVSYTGATIDVAAVAAVRATREARVRNSGFDYEAIVGTPLAGERAGGDVFDGKVEVAMFPGELPADPDLLFSGGPVFRGLTAADPSEADYRFLRFRPPIVPRGAPLPHIRLDRTLQFLFGDRLG